MRYFKLHFLLAMTSWLGFALCPAVAEWSVEPAQSDVPSSDSSELVVRRWKASTDQDPQRRILITWSIGAFSKISTRIQVIEQEGLLQEIFKTAKCTGELLLSGGFYESDRKGGFQAEGLVVVNGRLVSSRAKWRSGGAFVVADNKPRVVPLDDLENLPPVDQAIQGKPIVVRHGKTAMHGDDGKRQWARALIGITRRDQLFIAVIQGAEAKGASLFEAAEIILALDRTAKIELEDVLALDGGPSAHMYIPAKKLHFGSESKVFVPNIICITGRNEKK